MESCVWLVIIWIGVVSLNDRTCPCYRDCVALWGGQGNGDNPALHCELCVFLNVEEKISKFP